MITLIILTMTSEDVFPKVKTTSLKKSVNLFKQADCSVC